MHAGVLCAFWGFLSRPSSYLPPPSPHASLNFLSLFLSLSSSPFRTSATVRRGCSPRIQKRESKGGTGTGHTTRAVWGREGVERGGGRWVRVVWMKRKGRYIHVVREVGTRWWWPPPWRTARRGHKKPPFISYSISLSYSLFTLFLVHCLFFPWPYTLASLPFFFLFFFFLNRESSMDERLNWLESLVSHFERKIPSFNFLISFVASSSGM